MSDRSVKDDLFRYGRPKFMGEEHSHTLRDAGMFFDLGVDVRMKTLCGIGDDLERIARIYGWETCETDWRKDASDQRNSHRRESYAFLY
jgi:hypothetical protein